MTLYLIETGFCMKNKKNNFDFIQINLCILNLFKICVYQYNNNNKKKWSITLQFRTIKKPLLSMHLLPFRLLGNFCENESGV